MDFSNTRISLDRPIGSYTKVQALYSHLVRNRPIWSNARAIRSSWQYLNAGCGPNIAENFLNLDYKWRPSVDLCWDLTRPLPLPSASLHGIFTEHCLEHIPRHQVNHVLAEFRRLLAPGGCLRVVLPDAELYIDCYNRSRRGEVSAFPYLSDEHPDGWTPIDAVNAIFRGHEHQYAYDFACLEAALHTAAFQTVKKWSFRQRRDLQLLIDTESRAVESFYT